MEITHSKSTDSHIEDNPITPSWRFNVFLDKIGQSITNDEISRMKSYCTDGQIGRKALNKAETATAFFQLLRDMDHLNTNNILLLQAMLWHIGRKDLHQEMVEFARECRKVPLHFFSPKEQPVNGYKHVKFHVRGRAVSRQEMETIRMTVAELLCVKITDVFFVGHIPSNSSVLIFMVPALAADVLHTMTVEDKDIFTTMKIDTIMLDGITIHTCIEEAQFQVSTSTIDTETEQSAKLLQERDKLRSTLDRLQECLVDRSEELRKAKESEDFLRRSKDQAVITCLTLLYSHRPATRIIDTLVSKSALVYFKHCLQQFQAKFPTEMDTINILLEAKELVACKTERELWKKHEENLKLMITLGRNELEMQQSLLEANTQGLNHNSRLAMGGAVFQRTTIEIGYSVAGLTTQALGLPAVGLPTKQGLEREETRAMTRISKMIGIEHRRKILHHLQIGKRKRKSLEHATGDFFMRLYNLAPRSESPLIFALQTVRLLDNQDLEAKVIEVIEDFKRALDQIRAIPPGAMYAPQVMFTEGKHTRRMAPDAMRRLHDDPKQPQECITRLQDLANVVQT